MFVLRPSAFILLHSALLLAACSPYAGERTYEEGSQTLEGLAFSEKKAGLLLWELTSPSGTLFEEQSLARLDRPELAFYEEGKLSSRAKAGSGVIHTKTREIELSTGVVLTSTADRSVMRTEALVYSPEKNRVYTDLPVDVQRPDGHMRGQGLEATPDLKEIRIKKQKTVITK